MSIIHPVQQGSEEWLKLRLGVPSASQAHRIITPGGKRSTQADGYMYELIAERLLHAPMGRDLSQNQFVQAGIVNEPLAASQFEVLEGVKLELAGWVTTDDGRMGCSPDRIIAGNRREAVEIKCPQPPNMMRYLLDGPGDDYRAQVQMQMLVGDFEVVHFYAYHERMPAAHIVVKRDATYQRSLGQYLREFCDKLDGETERAKRLGAYIPIEEVIAAYQPQEEGPSS